MTDTPSVTCLDQQAMLNILQAVPPEEVHVYCVLIPLFGTEESIFYKKILELLESEGAVFAYKVEDDMEQDPVAQKGKGVLKTIESMKKMEELMLDEQNDFKFVAYIYLKSGYVTSKDHPLFGKGVTRSKESLSLGGEERLEQVLEKDVTGARLRRGGYRAPLSRHLMR